MFIVSKNLIESHNVEIIKVINEDENDALKAYSALITDALKEYSDTHSIKNISDTRVEVFNKGLLGSYLVCVYTLHKIDNDDITQENSE